MLDKFTLVGQVLHGFLDELDETDEPLSTLNEFDFRVVVGPEAHLEVSIEGKPEAFLLPVILVNPKMICRLLIGRV